ncbi:unnamed protein product [Aphanomyces euteiches]
MIVVCLVIQLFYSSVTLGNLEIAPNVRREAAFVRATVVYMPWDRGQDVDDEFRWLHASWKDMLPHQPHTWRSDLVVVSDGQMVLPEDLNCSTRFRRDRSDPNQCVVILVEPSKDITAAYKENFEFVRAMNGIIASEELDVYDWILTTERNTFLAPVFAGWKPSKLTIGSGAAKFNMALLSRLHAVGREIKIEAEAPSLNDISHAWYGPTSVIKDCAKRSLEVLEYLNAKNFNITAEEYSNLPTYASLLAMPDCTYSSGGIDFQPAMLDVSTALGDAVSNHAHLRPHSRFTPILAKTFQSKKSNNVTTHEFALSMVQAASIPPPLDLTNGINQPFVRAIVVYFPFSSARTGQVELKWLHRTWTEMLERQPAKWRTDLVIFADWPSPFFGLLGCSPSIRKTKKEASHCIFVDSFQSNPLAAQTLNAINIFAASDAFLGSYDWILRTDLDAFIAPGFASWKPRQFTVGQPEMPYCITGVNTCLRLQAIAKSLNLTATRHYQLGTTWYGPAEMIQACAKLTKRVADHLLASEFSTKELDASYGRRGYPQWDPTFLHMYAGHIALQHCADRGKLAVLPEVLEASVLSTANVTKVAHIRAGMGITRFHALAFDGSENLSKLNTLKANNFVEYMAVVANQDHKDVSFLHGQSESFVRAAVIFLPSDGDTKFRDEMRWFHLSWEDMITHQPPMWRFDIVVFTDGDLPLLSELGCSTQLRKSPLEPNRCIVVHGYKKVKSKDFDYGYADSINVVATESEATKPYDWILRTDIDTFLTPSFAKWKPLKFTVGSVGGYCFDPHDTCKRLKGIAKKLDLLESPVDDIGSTWYGPTKMIQACGKLSMKVTNHLHLHEFNETEKSHEYAKVKVAGWPRWHYGVLTMYSGHLSIPTCTNSTGFDKRDDLLDYPTFENTSVLKHPHTHARQSYERFSKYKFRLRDYDGVDISKLNRSIVSEHAMYMALASKQKEASNKLVNGVNESFVRAAVLYIPPDKSTENELRWFYLSWKIMLEHQPEQWRTDLVVVTSLEQSFLKELDCHGHTRRLTRSEASRCIVITNYTLIRTKAFDFAPADTLNMMAIDDPVFDAYDWLLKTDTETFLGPAFAKWKPRSFVVGSSGGYCFDGQPTCGRLDKIGDSLNLTRPAQPVKEIGASWYGPAPIVRECAKLAVKVMVHLNSKEFTAEEKSREYYAIHVKGWPHWHYGILHMYAGHIAVQHCTRDVGFDKQNDMMDFTTESKDAVEKHAHLRARQGDQDFSSSKFRVGMYANVDPKLLDRKVVKDYAMSLALQAKLGAANAPIKFENGLNESFVRAAVVYLPSGGDKKFQQEMRWFHRSWREMSIHEPPLWRTDIVVYTDGNLSLWFDLGCTTQLRKSPLEPNRCIVVYGYKQVKSKDFDYGFADSINVVAIESEATKPYDWILRTDIDTFLTPSFAKWKPLKFTVGSVGGYCFPPRDTCDRLRGIAKKLGLNESPVDDIGSTWYGPAKMIQACGKLSMKVTNHLHLHEFNETEKSHEYAKVKVAGWPRWHYGVLTMYSGHLSIPTCTNSTGFDKRDDLIDYPTFENTSVLEHPHTHARQSFLPFSKFKLREGKYEDIVLSDLDLNKVNDYAMYMALDSMRHPIVPQGVDTSFLRAVILYMPSGDESTNEASLRWFYASWREMIKHQPPRWRTDIVIFSSRSTSFFDRLNCTTSVRRNQNESNRCIVVTDYKPIRNPDFDHGPADSMNVLAIDHPATEGYDYLMRTEIETFLTPRFATWKPSKLTFGTSGGYCFPGEPTCKRLKAISAKLNLTEPSDVDIGASWYGPAKLMKACGKFSMEVMKYLHEFGFNATEKSIDYYVHKVRGWPAWHYGVLYAYANHIALQHCTKDVGFDKVNAMMDFTTESNDKVYKHAHLRPSMSPDKNFSMAMYHSRASKDVDPKTLNRNRVKDYATYMAITAADLLVDPSLNNGLNDSFVRAAVIYLPSSSKDVSRFLPQFRWFHSSWQQMCRHQPKLWRTDIVVFTDGDVPLLRELGCTKSTRKSPKDADACIVVDTYENIKSKEFDYGFADSINVVSVDHAATKPYDWILRTDIDTFFTPVFAKWRPSKLTVGSVGGYCFGGETTCERLKGIAKKLKMAEPNYTNDVGSTWYGPAKLIQKCAQTSMKVIVHLHVNEFNETEKSSDFYRNRIAGWPSWHYGVLTMYSGHLAIHDCTSDVGGFDKRDDMIDYPAFETDRVDRHAHLHAWQGPKDFAKSKLFIGEYDRVLVGKLDPSIVNEFAMKIALQANGKGIN